ncbi:hypothetical protein [Streptomyces californicus]|uniref:hypothetical protein n=1 Tax=Streptomyces californicus TaxID=67351 RepID=UPI000515EFF7|nr:hypothetical protein [Streptomyces californicus]
MDTTAGSEPKGAVRKGVRTSRDLHTADPDDPTPERPGLRIYAPPVYRHHYDGARWSKRYGDTPTAAYACHCGQTGTATGPKSLAALVAEYDAHKSGCTGAPAATPEGRAAA